MAIVDDCEALPAKFPTVTMKVKAPAVVGVPLINPAEFRERPPQRAATGCRRGRSLTAG